MATDKKQIPVLVTEEDKQLITRFAELERESVGQFLLKSAIYRIEVIRVEKDKCKYFRNPEYKNSKDKKESCINEFYKSDRQYFKEV